MLSRQFSLVCSSIVCISLAVVLTQASDGRATRTRFACRGRPPGYYADVETGCQVYHMCDALGRQFSYTCPNTTLFQQRMLVCDHWYMVNCSKSESDYGANLLIGQRDKPFVSDEEMRLRTPRPDILSVPPNSNYYDGLKEAESKYPVHPGNSIVGVADSISSANDGLDSAKGQYRPPTSWSTGTGTKRPAKESQTSQDQGVSNQGQGNAGKRPGGQGQTSQSQGFNIQGQFESQSGNQNGQSSQGINNQGFGGQNIERPGQNQNGQSSQSQGFNNQGFGGQNIERPGQNQNGQSSHNSGFTGNQNGQSQGFNHTGQEFVGTNNQGRPRPPTGNQNTHNSQSSQSNGNFNQGFGGQNNQRPSQNTQNPPFNNQNQGFGTNNNLATAASQKPTPTVQTTPDFTQNTGVPQPSLDLTPPLAPKPTTTEAPSVEDYDLDIRIKNSGEDPVVNFINRFDPNSPTAHKTAMTPSEILDINQQLPQGHEVSAEDEKTTPRNKNRGKNFNTLEGEKKGVTAQSRFNTANVKPTFATTPTPVTSAFGTAPQHQGISQPDVLLLPPKTDYSDPPSTTVGPPIYYEWKWAVPAFELEPPKQSNVTYNNTIPTGRSAQGKRPFSDYTRPTPTTEDVTPSSFNTEYNISSYFVPDYIFPLDKPHPGYENDEAQTSFQVNVARPGRSSYGENPACPQCHPGYVKPGTCEPCIIER